MTLGPFSVSTPVGGRRQEQVTELFAPVPLAAAVADLQRHGWRINGQGNGWALVSRRTKGLHLESRDGGTVARRATPRAVLVGWLVVVPAVIILLGVLLD